MTSSEITQATRFGEFILVDEPLRDMANFFHTYYRQHLEESARTAGMMLEAEVGWYLWSKNPVNLIKAVVLLELENLRDYVIENTSFENVEWSKVTEIAIQYCEATDAAMLRAAAISEHRILELVRSSGAHVTNYIPAFVPFHISHSLREKIKNTIKKTAVKNLSRQIDTDFAADFANITINFERQINTTEMELKKRFESAQIQQTLCAELWSGWLDFKEYNIKFAKDFASGTLARISELHGTDVSKMAVGDRIIYFQHKFKAELTSLNERGTTIINQMIEYGFILEKRIHYTGYDTCNIEALNYPNNTPLPAANKSPNKPK